MISQSADLLIHYNWATKEEEVWWLGPCTTMQEPCFVPCNVDKSPEDDGYLMIVLNRLDQHINELAIIDAQSVKAGPVALVKLPLRPRTAVHRNFVDHRDIKAFGKQKESRMKDEPAPLLGQQKGL